MSRCALFYHPEFSRCVTPNCVPTGAPLFRAADILDLDHTGIGLAEGKPAVELIHRKGTTHGGWLT